MHSFRVGQLAEDIKPAALLRSAQRVVTRHLVAISGSQAIDQIPGDAFGTAALTGGQAFRCSAPRCP